MAIGGREKSFFNDVTDQLLLEVCQAPGGYFLNQIFFLITLENAGVGSYLLSQDGQNYALKSSKKMNSSSN